MQYFHAPALAALAAILVCAPAGAALGDGAMAASPQRRALKAFDLRNASGAAYSVRESTLASGTRVREYLLATGLVFAVTWDGPFVPDLRELLGEAPFAALAAAASQSKGRRGPVSVQRPELVLHSGGHMRAFSGYAYLPTHMPAGLDIDALR